LTSRRSVLFWPPDEPETARALSDAGYGVKLFKSADEIRDVLSMSEPLLALILLKGRSAEQMVETLRKMPGGAVLPVVLKGTRQSRIQRAVDAIAQLGADGFIPADGSVEEIISVLERFSKTDGGDDGKKREALQDQGGESGECFLEDESGEKLISRQLNLSESLSRKIRAVEARLSGLNTELPPDENSVREGLESLASLGLGDEVRGIEQGNASNPLFEKDAAGSESDLFQEQDTGDEAVHEIQTREVGQEIPPEATGIGTYPGEVDTSADTSLRSDKNLEMPELAPTMLTDGELAQVPEYEEVESSNDADAANGQEVRAATHDTLESGRVLSYSGMTKIFVQGEKSGGSIDDIPVPLLLSLAAASRISGCLEIVSGETTRSVVMSSGQPLTAESSAPEDRLLEILRARGRLTESQYRESGRMIEESGRRAGILLLEQGIIRQGELFPLVRSHYEEILFSSFLWGDGKWAFMPSTPPESERIRFDLPAGALVMEGIRRKCGGAFSLDILGGRSIRPRREDGGLCHMEETGLVPGEQHIADLCSGESTLDDIAADSDQDIETVACVVLGLYFLGHISLEKAPDLKYLVREEGAEPVAYTPIRSPRQRDVIMEKAKLEEKIEVVRNGSYFSILGIPPDASGHEIRQAYRRLKREISVENYLSPDLENLVPMVEEALYVIEEAYEILADREIRHAYRRACGE